MLTLQLMITTEVLLTVCHNLHGTLLNYIQIGPEPTMVDLAQTKIITCSPEYIFIN